MIAEVTSQREPVPGRGLRDITYEKQWTSAVTHTQAALLEEDGPERVYCIMVSRASLRDWRQQRKLEAAPEELDAALRDRVKFLVLDIKDMGFVGRKLHEFYCLDRTDVRRLSDKALASLLDELHARTLAWMAEGKTFPKGWAGQTFAELLETRVKRPKPKDRKGRTRKKQ
ncbi:MAG: hypothetical protein OXE57_16045 [Alphaproteobacteria bacterium]|nr:hypothetical protein [Alphaproteobacteria bacterium]